jgi:hypothetical protein
LARAVAVIGTVAALLPGPARGGERYYSMIFGSQSSPKLLRYTHTWATFIRVEGEGDGESVTMGGPFEMHPAVYERSLQVKSILDSGAAQYRAISTPRDLLVSDCIHAVAAIDPVFGRGHYPLIRIGEPASRFIARQVMTRSVFDQYQTEASWLIPALELDRYSIEVVAPQQIPKRSCVLCRCPE